MALVNVTSRSCTYSSKSWIASSLRLSDNALSQLSLTGQLSLFASAQEWHPFAWQESPGQPDYNPEI